MEDEKLKDYIVTFYYHTCGTVAVKARNKNEAIKLADSSEISEDLLLYNLQEDDCPSAEEV